jgi:hypothetical protein
LLPIVYYARRHHLHTRDTVDPHKQLLSRGTLIVIKLVKGLGVTEQTATGAEDEEAAAREVIEGDKPLVAVATPPLAALLYSCSFGTTSQT